MTTIDISLLAALIGLVVSACSIAAFFLGRKKRSSTGGTKIRSSSN